jgi:hypothetical protein
VVATAIRVNTWMNYSFHLKKLAVVIIQKPFINDENWGAKIERMVEKKKENN